MDKTAALLKAIAYFGSQKELARVLGVTQATINHWLNRDKKIPVHQALKISLYTEGAIAIEDLIDEEEDLILIWKELFLKSVPVVCLPLDKIIKGNKRCPIYPNFREHPSLLLPTHLSLPIFVDKDNKLIVCECRLRACPSKNSRVKVYRLNTSKMIENKAHMDGLIRRLPISERVEVGLFVEEELGNRQGKRTDLELRHAYAEVKPNGKRREIAAKIAGFRSYFTYSQAKEIVKNCLPEVIKAVDDEFLTISTGHQIANLSEDEQAVFMAMMREKIKTKGATRCNEFAR